MMPWKILIVKDSLVRQINFFQLINWIDSFQICFSELAEVQSVASAPPAQVGTKKIDEKAFFDVSSIAIDFPITFLYTILL